MRPFEWADNDILKPSVDKEKLLNVVQLQQELKVIFRKCKHTSM